MKPTEYPNCCPRCGNKEHDPIPFEVLHDDEFLTEDYECSLCNHIWRCEYEFIKWESLD